MRRKYPREVLKDWYIDPYIMADEKIKRALDNGHIRELKKVMRERPQETTWYLRELEEDIEILKKIIKKL